MTYFAAAVHLLIGWYGLGTVLGVALIVGYFVVPQIPMITHAVRSFMLHAGVALLAISVTSAWFFTRGVIWEVNQIAAKNREATHAVEQATKDIDQCYASGRSWNISDGVCE